ncbi:MAG: hypothetical protein V2J12_10630 [Gammaproteobacteria bacterium]|nr:hypothetical protein [Gammaproteobacteria bacterium]
MLATKRQPELFVQDVLHLHARLKLRREWDMVAVSCARQAMPFGMGSKV